VIVCSRVYVDDSNNHHTYRENEMKTKTFALNEILSATTGKLLCDFGKLRKLFDFLTQDSLMTHQLPRASDECVPWLKRWHPELFNISTDDLIGSLQNIPSDDRMAICTEWVNDLIANGLPSHITLSPIPIDDHDYKDPTDEAIEMVGDPDRVIIVSTPDNHNG